MNEILQQRIEFVQAGRNTTHAQIKAKRNLREELETEMEKYLARGGKVESLKVLSLCHVHRVNKPKSKGMRQSPRW